MCHFKIVFKSLIYQTYLSNFPKDHPFGYPNFLSMEDRVPSMERFSFVWCGTGNGKGVSLDGKIGGAFMLIFSLASSMEKRLQ